MRDKNAIPPSFYNFILYKLTILTLLSWGQFEYLVTSHTQQLTKFGKSLKGIIRNSKQTLHIRQVLGEMSF